MQVIFFHPFGEERRYERLPASVWIRCLQLVPYLEAHGVCCGINRLEVAPHIAVFVRWQDTAAYDLAKRLKRKGTRIIVDLCVNYLDPTSVPHLGTPVTPRHREECLRMLSLADSVTCASAFIAQRVGEVHPKAFYVPDSVNLKHFRHTKPKVDFHRSPLRAVWSGIHAKARELEPILPLLGEAGVELTVISDQPPELKVKAKMGKRRFPYRFLKWRYGSFPRDILEGEICVCYRQLGNPYNMGHSIFKIGVFLACGVPAIASPLPSYREVLGDGMAGVLCHSLEEWKEAIAVAGRDRELLCRWSSWAKEAMLPYSTESVASQYLALFRQLTSGEA